MAWTVVETPNARYVLIFKAHDFGFKVEQSPLKFDAVVLEGVGYIRGVAERENYANIVKQALENNSQIWVADISPTKKSFLRARLGQGVVVGSFLAAFIYSGKKIYNRLKSGASSSDSKLSRRELFSRILKLGIVVSALSFPTVQVLDRFLKQHSREIKHKGYWNISTMVNELESGKGLTTIRNAIVAEKTESFLAPKLHEELGRKPVIAMCWGGAHYGILGFLQNPQKRKDILAKHKLGDFVKESYPISYKIHFNEKGQVKEVEEFHNTLKVGEKPKPQAMLKRRELLRRAFGRRKMA